MLPESLFSLDGLTCSETEERRDSDLSGEEALQLGDLALTSDANLVVAIAQCHQAALAEAYRRHGRAVHALARRILRNNASAEEIAQEIFVDLWRHPEKFDSQRGTLCSFLLARTHGRSIDLIRSENARRCREERTIREAATGEYDVEYQVWDLAVAEQVQGSLSALPEELREPIVLAYFGGHTYKEVARLLGLPEGTVKGRIRMGLGRLRVNLITRGIKSVYAEAF